MVIAELKIDNGQVVGVLMVHPKKFKTGSVGYYGNGKIEMGGKRYQVQVQLVELGTKPGTAETEPPETQKKARRGSRSA
jgi:hypothetical protein